MKFTIKRDKWLRGPDDSVLFDGKNMCCLGFVAEQCGVKKKEMRSLGDPSQISESVADVLRGILVRGNMENNALTSKAIEINDDENINDTAREKKLLSLFKKHGHTLIFKD